MQKIGSYPEPYLIAEGIHRPLENSNWRRK